MTNTAQAKRHIFISYAWEDQLFAHWLAKMLTRYGYYVWIDKLQLMGGEPFPQEIEKGIANSAYLLAVMSKASLNKESPRRERTLASKEAKKRSQSDFIIPIICDDLSPNDLDFVTTELTALIFTDNWANGLSALLEKLKKAAIPTEPDAGLKLLSELSPEVPRKNEPEVLVSNLLQIKEMPPYLLGFEKLKIDLIWLAKNKGYYYEQDHYIWSFESPDETIDPKFKVPATVREISNGIKPQDVLIFLIDRYIRRHLISKGLKQDFRDLYFPIGLLPKDKISYTGFSGRKTNVTVSGTITSGYKNGTPVQFRYYLMPDFHTILDRFSTPFVRLAIRIRVSDLAGRYFNPNMALTRRKKVVRAWFNRQWINRYYGITSWFTNETDITLFSGKNGNLIISGKLQEVESCLSIDDENIGVTPEENNQPDIESEEAHE
jgi:hypothetical protein